MSKQKKKRKAPTKPSQHPASALPSRLEQQPREATGPVEAVVAVGLALIVFYRPQIDGMTFPDKNPYFLAAIVALTVVWGVAQIVRREPLRFGVAIGLLGGFLVVGALTALDTVRYDATYNALLIWTGHFLFFVLAANALRTRLALALVLGTFVLISTWEGVYAVLHTKYLLPLMRERVLADSAILQRHFDQTQLLPELAHRVSSNRAFGSFLHANSLAAWLLLGIPFGLGSLGYAVIQFSRGLKLQSQDPVPEGDRSPWWATIFPRRFGPADPFHTLLTTVLATCFAFFVITMYYTYYFVLVYRNDTWQNHLTRWLIYCLVLPLAIGAATWLVARTKGLRAYVLLLVIALTAFMAGAETRALWMTYSRGGMLATTVALATGAGLLLYTRRRSLKGAAAVAGKTVLFLAVVSAGLLAGVQQSADAQPAETTAPVAQQPGADVVVGGTDVTWTDFKNPATMGLRLGYWRSGLRIAADHFWTGVGLGNFQTMYTKHQCLGTAPVKQAHNDYLQMLCETGVFGALLFVAFWAYVLFLGFRRILAERDRAEQWLLTGLFTGVLAFVLHAVVDFNFSNPSLATTVFVLAGALLSLGASTVPSEDRPRRVPGFRRVGWPAGIIIVCLALLTAWRVYPIYQVNQRIGNVHDRKARFLAARSLVAFGGALSAEQARPIRATDVLPLIPDREQLEAIGVLRQLGRDQRFGPFVPGAAMDLNTYWLVQDTAKARAEVIEIVRDCARIVEEADSLFPYDADVAGHCFQWHDLLSEAASDPEKKQEAARASLKWTEKAVQRSPEQWIFHDLHAKVLWRQGKVTVGDKQVECYTQAIEEFEKAAELYPIEPECLDYLGKAQIKFGQALRAADRNAEGTEMYNRGVAALKRAEELRRETERMAGGGS